MLHAKVRHGHQMLPGSAAVREQSLFVREQSLFVAMLAYSANKVLVLVPHPNNTLEADCR